VVIQSKQLILTQAHGRSKTFNRLLTDATNQVRYEYDTTVAISFTVDEALSVMAEWGRENSDLELAQKVSSQLEDEFKQNEKILLKNDEAVALRLAIEETRRIKALAREKEIKEQRDVEYAKAILEADEKEVHQMAKLMEADQKEALRLMALMEADDKEANLRARELFEADQKEAQRLARELNGTNTEVDGAKCIDDKDTDALDPYNESKSIYIGANDGYCSESKDDYCDETDYKAGSCYEDEEDIIQQAIAQVFQLESDSTIALEEQESLNAETKREQQRRLSKDYRLSRRLAVQTEREAHRLAKYQQLQRSFERSQRDEQSVRQQWLTAEAEVESVCESVCITIFLPNLIDVVVKASSSGRKVRMFAKRLVIDDDAENTVDNSTFRAEFRLQCEGLRITDSQLSHDYSSESGLLHVYIEGVLLDCDDDESGAKATECEEKASSKCERLQQKARSGAMDRITDGFLRIFNAVK